jgi:hypothetical protein
LGLLSLLSYLSFPSLRNPRGLDDLTFNLIGLIFGGF